MHGSITTQMQNRYCSPWSKATHKILTLMRRRTLILLVHMLRIMPLNLHYALDKHSTKWTLPQLKLPVILLTQHWKWHWVTVTVVRRYLCCKKVPNCNLSLSRVRVYMYYMSWHVCVTLVGCNVRYVPCEHRIRQLIVKHFCSVLFICVVIR